MRERNFQPNQQVVLTGAPIDLQCCSILYLIDTAGIAHADATYRKYGVARATMMAIFSPNSTCVNNEKGDECVRELRDEEIVAIEEMCAGLTTVTKTIIPVLPTAHKMKFGARRDKHITKLA